MTPTPTPPPAAPSNPIGDFVSALLDHSPDSLRRLGAAMTLTLVPFANAYCAKHFGFSVPDTQVIAIETGLGLYIAQSFAKAFKIAGPLVLAAAVVSSSCAHAPSATRISGAALSGTDITFEAVAASMQKLSDGQQLTAEQVAHWNKFLTQFQMTFHSAKALWEGARASDRVDVEQQAAASLTVLLSDLQYFADLVGLKVTVLPPGAPS